MSTSGEAKSAQKKPPNPFNDPLLQVTYSRTIVRFEHRYADWLKYQKPLPHMVDYIEIFFWTAFGSLVFFDNTGVIIVAEAVVFFLVYMLLSYRRKSRRLKLEKTGFARPDDEELENYTEAQSFFGDQMTLGSIGHGYGGIRQFIRLWRFTIGRMLSNKQGRA